jgi:hypothetical protein
MDSPRISSAACQEGVACIGTPPGEPCPWRIPHTKPTFACTVYLSNRAHSTTYVEANVPRITGRDTP